MAEGKSLSDYAKIARSLRKGTRKNKDNSESTVLMRTETDGRGNWFSFPTLFQNEDGEWVDMSEQAEQDWYPVYEEAMRRGEVFDFGENKQAALDFAEGAWKEQEPLPRKGLNSMMRNGYKPSKKYKKGNGRG